MNSRARVANQRTAVLCIVTCCISYLAISPRGSCDDPAPEPSVQEIRAVLESIDPYLPVGEIAAEVDVFGSTTMDALAHGWATGFNKFYPRTKVVISAQGSESVFERLAKNPSSVGMLSRHVTEEELKNSGLKRPVAVMVSHEALGIFVNKKNPLESISYQQLVTLLCSDNPARTITWKSVGVSGPLADQPVHVIGRNKGSGSRKFVEQYLFRARPMLPAATTYSSNAEVVKAVEEDPQAIAICGLKCGSHNARTLHLREDDHDVPEDDHAILTGQYPLTRPLTLVVDLGATDDGAKAGREFVRYALSQAGQMQTILAGFFPLDPPTLRSEALKLETGLRPTPIVGEGPRVSGKDRRKVHN